MMNNYYPGKGLRLMVLLLLSWLAGRPVQAQSYLLPATGSTSITTCAGTLYDDGGPSGAYTAYAGGSVTVLPATAGYKVRLVFDTIAVEPGPDILYVYDGASTAAPLLGSFDSAHQPGTLYGTTASGALTLRMVSDGVGQYAGFAAAIACVATVPPPARPDLTVQNQRVSFNSILPGDGSFASCRVANTSNGTAASSTVGYYLSRDAVLDYSDVLLKGVAGPALSAGQTSNHSDYLTIPATTTPGSYYLLFAADYQQAVVETDETNNVASLPLTVRAPAFDLEIQQPNASPTSANAGTIIALYCFINNLGSGTAPSSSVGFYFSTDATLDAGDQLLTTNSGGPLAPATPALRYADYGTAAVPAGTPPGTYYVLFVADYQNQVPESNEANNVSAVSITVSAPGPDLVIMQEALGPATVAQSGLLQMSYAVQNNGSAPAASSTTGFYLSTNQTFDAADVVLATEVGGALVPNQLQARYASAIIPVGTALGSYYVLFVADPANAVAESNETNNVRSLPLTVVAPTLDLLLANPTVYPNNIIAGGTSYASSVLLNQGNLPANPATVGCYLSTDAVLDAADVLLGSTTGLAAAGSSNTRNFTLAMPAGTPQGRYYVLFVADHLNQVAETNETNNLASVPIQVVAPLADLVLAQSFLTPGFSTPGAVVYTNYYIQNLGNVAAASSKVGYYLSADTLFDAADVLLLTVPGSSLAPGGYQMQYDNMTIPAGTPLGRYYVLFVADPDNAVAESNEANNLRREPLLLGAPGVDLLISQAQVLSANATPGYFFQTTCTVYNARYGDAQFSPHSVYLSADTLFDARDVALGGIFGPVLSGNVSSVRNESLLLPVGTAAGNYHLLFVADPANLVPETDETNNLRHLPLTVGPPLTGTLVPGYGTASVTSCATTIYDNGGANNYAASSNGSLTLLPATAGALVQLVFTAFDTEDGHDFVKVYNGTTTSAPLLGTYSGSQVPPPITATNPAGALTVVFSSDAYVNGAGFEAFVSCVTTPQPDLVLTQIGASPSTVPAGSSLTLTATVANQGAGPASASAVGFYLSANQVLDASDVPLGTSAGAALAGGLSASRPLVAPVPASTPVGPYYVLFVVDPNSAVAEANEANNVVALRITVTQALATREQAGGYTVVMAPNPVAAGQPLRLQLDGPGSAGPATAALYNALGQRVQQQSIVLSPGRANRTELATAGLARGVYLLRLTGPGLYVTRRVVVE